MALSSDPTLLIRETVPVVCPSSLVTGKSLSGFTRVVVPGHINRFGGLQQHCAIEPQVPVEPIWYTYMGVTSEQHVLATCTYMM